MTSLKTDSFPMPSPELASHPADAGLPALRVLFVAASPPNAPRLDIDKELRSLSRAFRKVPFERVHLSAITAATLSDILEEIIRCRPQIIHISAHSTSGAISLESESEQGSTLVPIQIIAEMIHTAGGVELVIFATNDALSSAYFLSMQGIKTMAFMRPVADSAAIRFSGAFYSSLAGGLAIPSAFSMARIVSAQERIASGHPVLFDRGHTGEGLILAIVVSNATLTADDVPGLHFAMEHLARKLNADLVATEPAITGSFLKRFWLWFKNDEQLHQRLREAEDAVLARGRDMPLSRVTSEYSLAIERIMNSFSNPNAPTNVAFVLDTLLIVQYPGPDGKSTLVVKQLTREEQRRISANPALMASPGDILARLMEHTTPTIPISGENQTILVEASESVGPTVPSAD
ncbi:CHAT domain-containing protein [Nannocystis sp. ILAH1]|uniref:CHAT domain-containing protein n=1 Tax=unclassified Nannocystis TaxID=2627009 RepID=UPI00226F5BA2|nr:MULTISPECIES: CHAT domain-containing protein [unclassified Nannocystis]MCY0992042.1 CHAT domain-containing protein [Nannocystis sp. ILAH1]MCY1064290.1 CHAT domain-containing protein [Nannocystis sp. RBIL2]